MIHYLKRIQFVSNLKKMESLKDRFTYIFRTNAWRSNESVSGPGSTLNYTKNIRKEIPRIIERYCIHTILDAPCGDFHWFRYIDLPYGTKYIGVDIVDTLVDDNNKRFGNPNTSFLVRDITSDKMPDADLWFCRDFLFHLSNEDIFMVMGNLKQSNVKWFMSSTHPGCRKNKNIVSGDFRLINLELPCFNFPKPTTYIDDWIEGFPERKIGLWRKEAICHAGEGGK